jgi:hypothetical protein
VLTMASIVKCFLCEDAAGSARTILIRQAGSPRLHLRWSRCTDEPTLMVRPRLKTKRVHDTQLSRAINNRPMSSRSQALFRSISEMKHALRQRNPCSELLSSHSFTVLFGSQVLEELVAGRDDVEVGTTNPVQGTSRA